MIQYPSEPVRQITRLGGFPLLFGFSAACILFLSAVGPIHAAPILLQYNFNDSGTTTASTGTDTTSATLLNSSGVATDLHGAAGSGVSGAASDLAFDNTASTAMGNQPATGGTANAGDDSAVDSLKSFTIQGWFKTAGSTPFGATARLLDKFDGSNGFYLYGTTGTLVLGVDGLQAVSSAASLYSATQQWVFFAVTYDGSLATNNVSFYVGSTSTSVALAGTGSINAGAVNGTAASLALGNRSVYDRPFDGSLDDIRIYGSTTDSSGVLTLGELEDLRVADAVPEPKPLALFGAALFVALIFRRRLIKAA